MTKKTDTAPKTEVIFGERYLRHRPFLVVTPTMRPQKSVKTEKAGWAESPSNWSVTERPAIVDRVSDKMMREAAVIIDLLNSKLVKSRFDDGKTDQEQVLQYYLGKYSAEVAEGIQIWSSQIAKVVADNPESAEKTETVESEN